MTAPQVMFRAVVGGRAAVAATASAWASTEHPVAVRQQLVPATIEAEPPGQANERAATWSRRKRLEHFGYCADRGERGPRPDWAGAGTTLSPADQAMVRS